MATAPGAGGEKAKLLSRDEEMSAAILSPRSSGRSLLASSPTASELPRTPVRLTSGAMLGAGIAVAMLCCLGVAQVRHPRAVNTRGAGGGFMPSIMEDEVGKAGHLSLAEGKCHDAAPGEKCHDALSWVMTEGIYGHPDWYPSLDYSSRIEEFQALLHKQDATNCPAPCKDPSTARRLPGVPGASFDLPKPQPERKPVTFYMFRAQSKSSYPLANVNTGNLAGVMWYLHNEIVPSLAVHRKYEITRMLRFKVTVEPTWEFYNIHRRLFSGFTAFDKGRCTAPDCDKVYKRFGAIPGCQFLDVDRLPYLSAAKTRIDGGCKGKWCNASVWYALPGECPGVSYDNKQGKCLTEQPGGLCKEDGVLGSRDCTYKVEDAGEISLDDLAGIEDYFQFYTDGHREYDPETDKGAGCDFWNDRKDPEKAQKRMDKAKELFDKKYPNMPKCDELLEPPCDFNAFMPGEFDWPSYSTRAEDLVASNGVAASSASTASTAAPASSSPAPADTITAAAAAATTAESATTTTTAAPVETTATAATTAAPVVVTDAPAPAPAPALAPAPSASPSSSSSDGGCHDAAEGERCFNSMKWVLAHGIIDHPEWYPGLSSSSPPEAVQTVLFSHDAAICPKPCKGGSSAGSLPTAGAADAARTLLDDSTTTAAPPSTTSAPTTAAPASSTVSSAAAAASTAAAAAASHSGACHDAQPGEKCHDDITWVMTQGIYGHPEWYPSLNYQARIEEVQAVLNKNDPKSCPVPCKDPSEARRVEGIPGASFDLPAPQQERKPVSFYMYRTQSVSDYPLENVNTANLAGVMWYLHNEIVPSHALTRKYNITRLLRFKVTIKPTWEFFNVHRRLFSGFTAFDNGKCTAPDCDKVYKRFGFLPGCQFLGLDRLPYHSTVKTRIDGGCKGDDCKLAVWYALPGPCPQSEWPVKSSECKAQSPGGLCKEDGVLGSHDCTFKVENAGEISLDELAGITPNYLEFYNAGSKEYDARMDKGKGCTFWDDSKDPAKNTVRMQRVKELFKKHFPDQPGCDDLPEPPCDFDAYFPDEFEWPSYATQVDESAR